MKRCYFVGGPFDGAWVDVERDDWIPSTWFLRPDPEERGQFGLIAGLLPVEGSERYILSLRGDAIATYLHEDIHAGGPVRKLQKIA